MGSCEDARRTTPRTQRAQRTPRRNRVSRPFSRLPSRARSQTHVWAPSRKPRRNCACFTGSNPTPQYEKTGQRGLFYGPPKCGRRHAEAARIEPAVPHGPAEAGPYRTFMVRLKAHTNELSRESIRNGFLLLVERQRELEIPGFVAGTFDGVVTGVARAAVRRLLAPDRAHHAFEAQVRDAVGLEKLANLCDRVRRGDQLGLARRVHAVEAGRNRRRAADSDVHLFRARRPHHAHDFAARRAANNRV